MISYVDDYALTVASHSYRGNICRLQDLFDKRERKPSRLGVSFSFAKTELIHWRTPSQTHSPQCVSPIQFKGELFHPGYSFWWLVVTGLFLFNENTIGPAIDLLARVLREASRDRR